MPQFNERGNRIRACDKSLVFRFSAGSLLLLFLAVVLLLNLKTNLTIDWKAITLFQVFLNCITVWITDYCISVH